MEVESVSVQDESRLTLVRFEAAVKVIKSLPPDGESTHQSVTPVCFIRVGQLTETQLVQSAQLWILGFNPFYVQCAEICHLASSTVDSLSCLRDFAHV